MPVGEQNPISRSIVVWPKGTNWTLLCFIYPWIWVQRSVFITLSTNLFQFYHCKWKRTTISIFRQFLFAETIWRIFAELQTPEKFSTSDHCNLAIHFWFLLSQVINIDLGLLEVKLETILIEWLLKTIPYSFLCIFVQRSQFVVFSWSFSIFELLEFRKNTISNWIFIWQSIAVPFSRSFIHYKDWRRIYRDDSTASWQSGASARSVSSRSSTSSLLQRSSGKG